jgi:hypothetical protein
VGDKNALPHGSGLFRKGQDFLLLWFYRKAATRQNVLLFLYSGLMPV